MINNLEITNPTLYDPAMGSGGLLGLTYITCKDKINPNNISIYSSNSNQPQENEKLNNLIN
jgi:type I restriction-modification system DNA methylase subunit